jgi:hypothetical protein
LTILALGGLLLVSGCGPTKATVTGKVSYNGKALGLGTVTFFGKDKEIVATAAIDSEGVYTAKVPTGPTMVAVETIEPPKLEAGTPRPKDMPADSTPGSAAKQGKFVEIPEKYKDPTQSDLKLDVKKGVNKFPIDLK